MTQEFKTKVSGHMLAKFADGTFHDALCDLNGLRGMAEMKTAVRIVCKQQDIEINEEAERLGILFMIFGYALGRDFGNSEAMEMVVKEVGT